MNKYLYANANAINVVDPSGHDGLSSQLTAIGIFGLLGGFVNGAISFARADSGHKINAFFEGFARGYVSSAITAAMLLFTPVKNYAIANAVGAAVSTLLFDELNYGLTKGASNSQTEILHDIEIQGSIALVIGAVASFVPGVPDAGKLAFYLSQQKALLADAADMALQPINDIFSTDAQKLAAQVASAARVAELQQLYKSFAISTGAILSADAVVENVANAYLDDIVGFIKNLHF